MSNISAQQILPSIVHEQYTAPIADPDSIPKFINALPVVKALGIRWDAVANPSFSIRMAECQQDLLGTGHLTTVFGYGVGTLPVTHPGATIVAEKNIPVTVTWINQLGFRELIPHDTTIMHAYSRPPYIGRTIANNGVPMAPHLHGGHTDADYDGTPGQWWTPLYHTTHDPLSKGPDFKGNVFVYDNSQESATLWYHDHAMGVTRLHAYEGAAGFYFVRDANENALIASNSIPSGNYEIELAFQDKMFYPDGRLAYPDVPALPGLRLDQTIWPEMFGDVNLVNGKAWPYLNVERRQYRFRIVNASDSRFYRVWLDTGGVAIPFKQIGADLALLPVPVTMNSLLIGCGTRYDLVVDFSNPALAGKTIIVRNDANGPYPNGDPVNPKTSGLVMQFRVGSTPVIDPVVLPASLRAPIAPLTPNKTRELILAEDVDEYGRIMPILGTVSKGMMAFTDTVSEIIKLNDVEEWDIYNTTEDAHPIHLHLVSFQVISSQDYTATEDPETHALTNILLVGSSEPPEPGEAGWKDTQIIEPGHMTRIRAKFDKPGMYVWHCHILSHEEHDMMRPFYVGTPVSVGEDISENKDLPRSVVLAQNYPNPFNPSTTIRFSVSARSMMRLLIIDILGREVRTLAESEFFPGEHILVWDGRDNQNMFVASGIYFYRLESGSNLSIQKMILLR
jgi:spore coat protein A